MDSPSDRVLTADEQIAEVRSSLARLEAQVRNPKRDQELLDARAYLEQLLVMHARGELEPLACDPASFL